MTEHKVWSAGTDTKVITIFDRIAEVFDIDVHDHINIDWKKAMELGVIKIDRRFKGK